MGSTPTPPTRVFIDSSVLIAASISKSGFARDLILMGVDDLVGLVVSPFVLVETRRNLNRKSPVAVAVFDAFVAMGFFLHSNPPDLLVEQVARRIESKDAAIVAGALAAQCQSLATFDQRHLLSEADRIKYHWDLRVETPKDCIARLALSGNDT